MKYYTQNSTIIGKGNFCAQNSPPNTLFGPAFEHVNNTGNDDLDYIRTDLGKYTNHSPNPNTILIQHGNIYHLVSNRMILIHQELALDYDTIPWQGERNWITL